MLNSEVAEKIDDLLDQACVIAGLPPEASDTLRATLDAMVEEVATKDPIKPIDLSALPDGSRVRATLIGTGARGWFIKARGIWQMMETPGGYYHSAALTNVEVSE